MQVRITRVSTAPKRLVKPFCVMFALFYIGYHALHGERGLYALVRDQRELVQLQGQLEVARAEREKMELRVEHLRDGSLDRDLLEEQMRRMMGVMRKGEVVVLQRSPLS